MDIRVISSDVDGSELRRDKWRNTRYIRCSGRSDDGEINDAIQSIGEGRIFVGLGDRWESIFSG